MEVVTKKKKPSAKKVSNTQIVAENVPEVKIPTIPSFTNEPTDDPTLFRVVDQAGDWTHYFQNTINQYLPAVNHILRIGFPKGQGLIEWLKRTTPEEAEKILKTAGERGSKVHAAIRDLIIGITIDIDSQYKNDNYELERLKADEWSCLLAFAAWAEKFQPAVRQCEVAVWNKNHFYAGTVDFVGTIKLTAGDKVYIDDKLVTVKEDKKIKVLLDWKTSKAVHDDYRLQVAAYATCLKQPVEYTGVVRVGTSHKNGGFEIKLWSKDRTDFHFERFIAAKANYEWLENSWTPTIVDIPTRLSVNIPVIKTKKVKKLEKIKEQVNAES